MALSLLERKERLGRLYQTIRDNLQTHENDRPHRHRYARVHQDIYSFTRRWCQKKALSMFLDGLIIDFCTEVFQRDRQYVEKCKKTKKNDGRRWIR